LQLRGNNRAIVQLTSKEEFYFTKGNLENMKRCFKMTQIDLRMRLKNQY